MADWDERYYLHSDHAVCKRCGAMVGGIAQHMENHDNWHAVERRLIDMAHPEWCHDCQSRHLPRVPRIDGSSESAGITPPTGWWRTGS